MKNSTVHIERNSFCPYFLIREVGLKRSSIMKLGDFSISEISHQLQHKEKSLKTVSARLCDELFKLIQNGYANGKANELLQLKRNIHNARKVKMEEVQAILPSSMHSALVEWNALREDLKALGNSGEEAIQNSIELLRNRFRIFFKEKDVQTAICHAQPELFRQLLKLQSRVYLKKKDKKALFAGVAYLYRMATKTSPFSHFTSTGICRFQEAGSNRNSPVVKRRIKEKNVLNVRFFNRIVDNMMNDANGSKNIGYVWNPTAVLSDEKCLVLRQVNGPRLSSEKPVETIGLLPSSEFFSILQTLLTKQSYPLRKEELTIMLAHYFPIPKEKLHKTVEKLIQFHVLIPTLNFNENHLNGLGQLLASDFLPDLPKERLEKLQLLCSKVKGIDQVGSPERLNQLSDITKLCREIASQTDDNIPNFDAQTIIHNSSYLIDPPSFDQEIIQSKLPFFGKLNDVLPLFNLDYSLQQWVKNKFDVFSRNRPDPPYAIDFFHFLFESEQANGDPNNKNPLLSPQALDELNFSKEQHRVQEMFVKDISEQLDQCSDELVLTDSFWTKYAELAKPFCVQSLPRSLAIMGQFETPEPKLNTRFILNNVFSGYGTMFVEPELSCKKTDSIQILADHWQTNTALFVDIQATFGFQGQIRSGMGAKNLFYPGHQVWKNNKHNHSWQNLRVKKDGLNNLILFDEKSDTRIIPLHRGTLSSMFYSPFYSFLTTLGPAYTPNLALYDRLLEWDSRKHSDEIIHYARVVSGDVVLIRKACSIPVSKIPKKTADQSNFSYYHMVLKWMKQNGVDNEVFMIPMSPSDYLNKKIDVVSFKRARKPFYINWSDYNCFRNFLRFAFLDIDRRISFVEVSPPLNPMNSESNSRVTEYIFETYQN